ncbi:MAG: FtsX-like permease family protein [Flavobacteriales bacterium]
MIKNYIKIAWRNLGKNKVFSFINIFGLAIGLAISLLLFLFTMHEKSFDTMHGNINNIYRVLLHVEDENPEVWCNVPSALTPALNTEIPNVESAARLLKHNFGEPAFVIANEDKFKEDNLYWSDSEIFQIFDIELTKGKKSSVLVRPNTAIISELTALKYFGNTDPIGQIVTVDNTTQIEITGVYKDFEKNSSLDCNVIASFSSTNYGKNPTWDNASFETFVLLNNEANSEDTEQSMQKVLDKNIPKDEQWFSFSLQPLNEVHLYSGEYTDSYISRKGDISEVQNLTFLAILILLIACINYMNLITARSQKRTKDVGINKTMGATPKSLIFRFYAETGLITFISLLLGIIIVIFSIPSVNALTDYYLDVTFILNPSFIISLLLIWLVTTLLAGSYPAFYLSRFSPKNLLQPTMKQSGSAIFIRKGLVVFQFAASVVLIIGVTVIFQQIQFVQNQKLGFQPENVVAINVAALPHSEKERLLTEYEKLNNVSSASLAQGFPGITVSGRTLLKNDNDKHGISINTNRADDSIIDALQLDLMAGTTLPVVKLESDTLVEVVLNREAIEYLGYSSEEALGKRVEMQLGRNAYVIGVVDNFNFKSLHEPIGAYAFHNRPSESISHLLLRSSNPDISAALLQFQEVFEKNVSTGIFELTFLDENLERLYYSERKTAQTGLFFCILAIFVACLGLFGLAAFLAEKRRKEIGVRKVLGASIINITYLFNKDFTRLVIISLILAFPMAYYIMNLWLQKFSYRIDLSWQTFITAGAAALVLAILTVSIQGIKAAIANPVKSLRSE